MYRRHFLKKVIAGLGSISMFTPWIAKTADSSSASSEKGIKKGLFPENLESSRWIQFEATGYESPVCGVIYRSNAPLVCGMPLGGISTGCLDLENNGQFGYCTIYNSHVPRRGKLNLPFLGITVDKEIWVLTTTDPQSGTYYEVKGINKADDIDYWGHYPIVDLQYRTNAPILVALRAWSPLILGDAMLSSTPGIVFEVRLHNSSKETLRGSLVFSIPGPTEGESGSTSYQRESLDGRVKGVYVFNDLGRGIVLGLIDDRTAVPSGQRAVVPIGVKTGGFLGEDLEKWRVVWSALPEASSKDSGASLSISYSLRPSETKIYHVVFAWYFPEWSAAGSPEGLEALNKLGIRSEEWIAKSYAPYLRGEQPIHTFTHMYAARFRNAKEVADFLANNHISILKRIIAWQQVIYGEETLPIWLRESLVNILHLLTEDGMWAQAKPPVGDWCKPEDGLFGMNESPRDCPQIECIPCSFYGNIPLVYFFPKLALSTMRGYINYMFYDGAAPWIFGGITGRPPSPPVDMASPNRGYQTTLNGACFVDMADRLWLRTGSETLLREFYPWVKKNTIYTMNLRSEDWPWGVVAMPTGNIHTEWFEHCEWYGITAHVGGIHLAQLKMAERMARAVGDENFAEQCAKWYRWGLDAMEEYLWTGSYYRNFYEPSTGKRSDLIFSYQMDGEWMADFHGIEGGVFPQDRVKRALAKIKEVNEPLSKIGALSFVNPDGSPAYGGTGVLGKGYDPYAFFTAELLILAMNYMYEGEKAYGIDLARRCMENIVLKHRYTWDMPNMIRGDTGEVTFGKDYYQMMILWSLPAAIAGQDLTGPVKPGGLVDRMMKAAAEE